MKDVVIEVLSVNFNKDLAEKYGQPGLKICPFHTVGQTMISVIDEKPAEMCSGAWVALERYVFALSHGVTEFYGGIWMKNPGEVVLCCPDGLRPVIFKMSAK